MDKNVCEKCISKDVCYRFDNMKRGNKYYKEYFSDDVICLDFKDSSKQIPQKPLPEERYYGVGKCPSCKVVFLDNTTKYCGNCGQALDWGEKTEN